LARGQVLQTVDQEDRAGPSDPALARSGSQQLRARPHACQETLKRRPALGTILKFVEGRLDLRVNSLLFLLSLAKTLVIRLIW
jgi:hypothetical protein